MREIEIRNLTIKLVDPGNGREVPMQEHLAIDLVLPPVDGIFPTAAGDLSVTRREEPPGLELKGDVVGGTIFVAINHIVNEPNPYRRFGGSVRLGERGAVTVYTREFMGEMGGSGKLLPTQPGPIRPPTT